MCPGGLQAYRSVAPPPPGRATHPFCRPATLFPYPPPRPSLPPHYPPFAIPYSSHCLTTTLHSTLHHHTLNLPLPTSCLTTHLPSPPPTYPPHRPATHVSSFPPVFDKTRSITTVPFHSPPLLRNCPVLLLFLSLLSLCLSKHKDDCQTGLSQPSAPRLFFPFRNTTRSNINQTLNPGLKTIVQFQASRSAVPHQHPLSVNVTAGS